jgi:circadian clock protein KaiC
MNDTMNEMTDEASGPNRQGRVLIRKLSTGVPGLDAVLGGGLPEYSFNLIAGAPGTGKTTLAQQILFANATPESPGLYFTVLGEPPLKVLRYQQQFGFFDPAKLEDGAIRFVHLGDLVLEQDLGTVLERIVREVQTASPRLIVVDSFRSIVRKAMAADRADFELQGFVQSLALHLTSWQATTFLAGEYQEDEMRDNAVFTVADGLLWLSHSVERNSVVRKLQVMKLRGQESMPGLHTFRITAAGLQVFPRSFGLTEKKARPRPLRRVSTGVAGLDAMLGGGLPAGDSALVAGPAGSGKTALCTQFIAEGIRQGEPGVIVVFEEHPAEYVSRAEGLDLQMEQMIREGKLNVIYLRPLDLSVDETLHEVREAVAQVGAQRVVIDSLSGFELALAPGFREDFRESLYRMVGALTGIGVTVLNSVEVPGSFRDLRFSPHEISFLTDDIILQRYVELDGQLQKVITVVKTRRGEHSKDLRLYDITSSGLVIGAPLSEYRGILTGFPERRAAPREIAFPGLPDGQPTDPG